MHKARSNQALCIEEEAEGDEGRLVLDTSSQTDLLTFCKDAFRTLTRSKLVSPEVIEFDRVVTVLIVAGQFVKKCGMVLAG